MDIKRLIQSFKFAGEGLVAVFKREQNFRIEIFIAILVCILMWLCQLSVWENLILVIVMGNVLSMEILNTVLEYLLDVHSKRKNKKFKFLKDAMAGAVVLNVIVAVIVGIVIFGRYFFK